MQFIVYFSVFVFALMCFFIYIFYSVFLIILSIYVQRLCENWNLSDPENFMLKFKDSNLYVCDANRDKLKVSKLSMPCLKFVIASACWCR